MPTKVKQSVWQTEDGKLYENYAAAVDHEIFVKIRKFCMKNFHGYGWTAGTIADEMFHRRKELIFMLINITEVGDGEEESKH